MPGVFTGAWDFDGGNLERSVGVGTLEYADAEVTAGLTTFETSDDTNVPHISGQPAKYMRVPAFDDPTQGYALTMPSQPVPGEGYLNRYTMAWDALIVNDLNWTPFFNSDPNNNNDADFYADDTGALGIGALGYSADAVVEPGRWYRIVFAANLVAGRVTVYVDGLPVHTRTGGSLANGRFALYTDRDPGPDIRLFNEGDPSGQYTHELLVNSFAFTSCELSRDQIAALGGPSASGIRLPIPILFQPPVIANDQVSLAWTGGTGPFAVQKKNRLSDAWQTVATSDARSFTETATGQTAFYRIIEP